MTTGAQVKSAEAPSALDQDLNSADDTPFAPVNTRWSLQLSAPPATNQKINSKVAELNPSTGSESRKQYDQIPAPLGNDNLLHGGLVH